MNSYLKTLVIMLAAMFIMTSCNEDLADLPTQEEIEKTTVEDLEVKNHRTCGLDHHMDQLMENPTYRAAYEKRIKNFEKKNAEVGQRSAACFGTIVLPMAVHFQGINGVDYDCLVNLAKAQVQILNEDYGGTNADISKWTNNAASYFPGINNGESCVQFALADQNHPSGYGLSDGQLAVTLNKTSGDQVNAFSGYINIFVRANTGLLGYSPLGGAGNGDGVVVDAAAFGTGAGCGSIKPGAPFNLGRTLTHELGHYLLLDHIWGDGCGQDDGVNDTPNAASEHYDCPSLGTKSCNSNDMFMNYMDYVNDACMYMFSAGQAARMDNYVNANLQNVISKGASVISNGNGGGNNGGNEEEEEEEEEICAKPTNLSVSNITSTSAKINFDAQSTAITNRIRYRKIGTSAWTVKTSRNLPFTVTGLQNNTTYQFQARARCPQGWTAFTAIKTFKTVGGGTSGCTDNEVKLRLRLDEYGSETSWELIDADNGQRMSEGGPYQDGQAGKVINKTLCLEDGCYTLYIDDVYGDGICCDYGNGFVKLFDENNALIGKSNGNFGYYDQIDFCVDGNVFSRIGNRTDVKLKTYDPFKKVAN